MPNHQDDKKPTRNKKKWGKRANGHIEYFDRIFSLNPFETWQAGLDVARQWLTLIEADSIAQVEVITLLNVAQANKERSTRWYWMAGDIYAWALSTGFEVPTSDVFFESDSMNLGLFKRDKAPVSAETIAGHFEQKAREDPNHKIWEIGYQCSQEWMRLIGKEVISPSEILNLFQTIESNSHISMGWIVLAEGIYQWSRDRNLISLWPESALSILEGFSNYQKWVINQKD